jgi:hypothetical protein
VTEGKTNKQIAAALALSEKTIKNYLSHAFEKLNVTRRAQAAVRFMSDVRYLGVPVTSPTPETRGRAAATTPPVVARDPRAGAPSGLQETKSA